MTREKIFQKENLDHLAKTYFPPRPLLSPFSFCNAFPFHVIFDNEMIVRQCGTSISRLIPEMNSNNRCKLTDVLTILRPHITLDYHSILSQINSVFVMKRNEPIYTNTSNKRGEEDDIRFKGQMVYLNDKDLILFQCSPSVMSIDDLYL
jgi:guanylate cyclase soluble subunit beta